MNSTLFRSAFAAALTLITPLALAQDMIEPESLEQGFVIVLNDRSGTATALEPVHVAGNFNGWNPSDPGTLMTLGEDGLWRLKLDQPTNVDRLSFKFALGDWDRVEVDENGGDVANRALPMIDAARAADGALPEIPFSAAGFSPESAPEPFVYKLDPDRELDVTGDVRLLETRGGGGPAADAERTAMVWLPPGYDDPANADKRYPVLYLLDGQNVFEKLPWLAAEWEADETAQRLIEQGEAEPFIMVAIPHAGRGRMSEYQAVPVFPNVPAAGPEFLRWLISEVKPDVDSAYRTRTDPANTAIGGASLGGTMSLFAGVQHPDVFGKVLVESPPMVAGGSVWEAYLSTVERWPGKVYLGIGGQETGTHESDQRRNQRYLQTVRNLSARLIREGLGEDRLLMVIEPDAVHNEAAWARRLPDAIRFLFGS